MSIKGRKTTISYFLVSTISTFGGHTFPPLYQIFIIIYHWEDIILEKIKMAYNFGPFEVIFISKFHFNLVDLQFTTTG